MTTNTAEPIESSSRWTMAPTLRWAALGAMTMFTILAVVFLVARDGSDRSADAARASREAGAYRDQLEPLVKKGGNIVAIGLRPGFTDIRDSRYSVEVLQGMADAWVSDLESVRASIDSLEHGDALEPAHRLYVRALDGYVEVAATMRRAASASGEARQALLEKAAALGRSADRTYDRADEALEQLAGPTDQEEER